MEKTGLTGHSINVLFVNIPELFSTSGGINKSVGLKKM